MQKRFILDTNIYGRIIDDDLERRFIDFINIHKNECLIYGTNIVRKELRNAPTHNKDMYNIRIALLTLYDDITNNHEIIITQLAVKLAKLYYNEYRKRNGAVSWDDIKNDMIIVGQSTISRLDIIVSEDNRTMLSDAAKGAYYSVNKDHFFITPNFIGYKEFKKNIE